MTVQRLYSAKLPRKRSSARSASSYLYIYSGIHKDESHRIRMYKLYTEKKPYSNLSIILWYFILKIEKSAFCCKCIFVFLQLLAG